LTLYLFGLFFGKEAVVDEDLEAFEFNNEAVGRAIS